MKDEFREEQKHIPIQKTKRMKIKKQKAQKGVS